MAEDGPEPSTDPQVFVRWWSRPVVFGIVRDFLDTRAHRRFVAEGGERQAWYAMSKAEHNDRIERQTIDFDRLCDELGTEVGVERWHAQAESWPLIFGANDAAGFERHLLHQSGVEDDHRGSSPLFRRTWPEWHPNMTPMERISFGRLLADERETRLPTEAT